MTMLWSSDLHSGCVNAGRIECATCSAPCSYHASSTSRSWPCRGRFSGPTIPCAGLAITLCCRSGGWSSPGCAHRRIAERRDCSMQAGRPALAGAGYTCQRLVVPARGGIVLVLVVLVFVLLLLGGPGRSHCRRGREQ